MIGEPTLDPRQGDRRKKALQSALARQTSAISRFARTGIGRGAVSGFGRRPVSVGGRPSGILNFLGRQNPSGYARGLQSYIGQSGGLGQLVAPSQLPTAPLPSAAGGMQAPSGGGSVGTSGGSDPQMTADALNAENPGGGAYVTPTGSVFEGSLPNYSLIPLGGGIFIDPISGSVLGATDAATGLREGI